MPKIFVVVFTAFISDVEVDAFNFVFELFTIANRLIGAIVCSVLFIVELFEIIYVVDIVWNLSTSAGNPNVVFRYLWAFLLLRACTVFRI